MKSRRLTDEQIIQAYKCCFIDKLWCDECPCDDWGCELNHGDMLDLIKRLQDENAKQKAEIERLTKIAGDKHLREIIAQNCKLNEENDELKKQVDELTEKLGKVLLGIKADEVLIAKGVEQAVKDTAEEILQSLIDKAYVNECIDLTVAEVKAWFREDYGVEVE